MNALLETGETFLEHILNTCREAGLERLCPVLNRDTPDMLSSLRLGFRENPDCSHYLIFPVDFPYVRASTVQALAKASATHPTAIIRPSHQGRTGHPIIIPASQDWHMDLPRAGLAALIHHSGLDILDLELDDPGILRNINHPGD